MVVAGGHGRLTRDQRTPPPERSPDNDFDRNSDRADTDRPGTGPIPVTGRPRDDPLPGLPAVLHPRSGDSCIAATPAGRPRSAAGTNHSARPSPSRPPDPAGRSPSTNAPTAATGTSASNAARAAAPSPDGSASAARAQIVTGRWRFPTCSTRRWSPSPTNSQPRAATAKAKHGLAFAQHRRSAPRTLRPSPAHRSLTTVALSSQRSPRPARRKPAELPLAPTRPGSLNLCEKDAELTASDRGCERA